MELRRPKRSCRVAVLFNLGYEPHRAYADMIRRIIGRDYQFIVTFMNVEVTQEAVRKKVLASVNSPDPYDVFVPIGLRLSIFLKRVYSELRCGKAIFMAVRDPLRHCLIDSLESPGANVTLVASAVPPNTAAVEKLAIMGKHIRRVVLPFMLLDEKDPVGSQVDDITKFFETRGIVVKTIALSSPEYRFMSAEVEQFLKDNVEKHDIVLILEGAFPDFYREAAYLCFERDAVLHADTTSSLYRGAAFAFAAELEPVVTALHETLILHWVDGVPLGDIPAKIISDDRAFFVNTALLRTAGFPEEVIELFKKSEGVTSIKMWVDCPINRTY